MALSGTEQIYNLTLGLIGEYEVTEGATSKKQYILCSRFYAEARDEVLVMHPWNEAIKQAMVLQQTTYPLFDYVYKYALPSDCLRVLSIGEDITDWQVQGEYIVTDHIISPPQWITGTNYTAGQYVSVNSITYLCATSHASSVWADESAYWTTQSGDYGYIKVTYIYQLTDTTKFSIELKNAIAHKLAIKIATAITNNPKVKIDLVKEFEELVMPQARSIDAMQGKLRPIFDSQWIRSRR